MRNWLVFLLFTICLGPNFCLAQYSENKKELLNKSLEIAKKLEDDQELDRRFIEAAVAIDYESLMPIVLEKLDIAAQLSVDWEIIHSAGEYGKFELALTTIAKAPFDWKSINHLFNLSMYAGAKQDADAFQKINDWLVSHRKAPYEHRYAEPGGNDYLVKETTLDGELLFRSVEELRFAYAYGQLLYAPLSEKFEYDLNPFEQPEFADWTFALHARRLVLKNQISKAIDVAAKIKNRQVKLIIVSDLFEKMSSNVQDYPEVSDLSELLIQLQLEGVGQSEIEVEPAQFFTEESYYIVQELGAFTKRIVAQQILDALIAAGKTTDGIEYAQQAFLQIDKDEYSRDYAFEWLRAVVGRKLSIGNHQQAIDLCQEMMGTDKLPDLAKGGITPLRLFRAAAIAKDSDAMAKYSDMINLDGAADRYRFAELLIELGMRDRADEIATPLKDAFKKQLEEKPEAERGKFAVDYATTAGWKFHHGSKTEICPLSDVVLDAFEEYKDQPGLSELVNRNLNSFTPPTPASKRMLRDMREILGESEQTTDRVEQLQQIKKHIPKCNEKELQKVLLQSIKLLKKLPDEGFERRHHAGELAFLFAEKGSLVGMNGCLALIKSPRNKCWVMLECAKALPPANGSLLQQNYTPPSLGGGGMF